MKPFSENAQCMKCGGREVGVAWRLGRGVDCPNVDLATDHMQRLCERCGFMWEEAPLNLLVPTGVEREGA